MQRRKLLWAAAGAPLYASGPLQFFSKEEAVLVECLCDQIIPRDQDPGAKDAGVLYYIDRQLSGTLARFSAEYREKLPLLNRVCRERMKAEFPQLPFEKQTEFLRSIEAESRGELAAFFQLVIDHTMQGFYGSPKHGGNRDEASWRMLKIQTVMREEHKH